MSERLGGIIGCKFPMTGGCSEGLGAFRFFFKPSSWFVWVVSCGQQVNILQVKNKLVEECSAVSIPPTL